MYKFKIKLNKKELDKAWTKQLNMYFNREDMRPVNNETR